MVIGGALAWIQLILTVGPPLAKGLWHLIDFMTDLVETTGKPGPEKQELVLAGVKEVYRELKEPTKSKATEEEVEGLARGAITFMVTIKNIIGLFKK